MNEEGRLKIEEKGKRRSEEQAPRTNIQAPEKHQNPNTKTDLLRRALLGWGDEPGGYRTKCRFIEPGEAFRPGYGRVFRSAKNTTSRLQTNQSALILFPRKCRFMR